MVNADFRSPVCHDTLGAFLRNSRDFSVSVSCNFPLGSWLPWIVGVWNAPADGRVFPWFFGRFSLFCSGKEQR
jgi:hypothetical protein